MRAWSSNANATRTHSRCEKTEQLLPSGTPEKCTILTGKRASTAGIKVSFTSSETQRSQRDHFQSPGEPLCRVLAVPRSATLAPWREGEQRAARPLACLPAGRHAARGSRHGRGGDAYDCDRYLAPSLALSAPFNLPAFVSFLLPGGNHDGKRRRSVVPVPGSSTPPRPRKTMPLPAPCGPL